jgi:RND superfamily putative drug exporter
MRQTFSRWPEAVACHPWLIVLFWLALTLVLIPGARHVEDRLEVAARMPSEQAQVVHDDLQRRFRSPFTDRVLLVVEGVPLPTTPEGREALETIVREVKKTPGVAGTLSSLDTRDAIFAGKAGGFLIIVGLDAGGLPIEDLLPRLRATTQALTARLKPAHPNAWLGWTGEVPMNFDLRRASAADARSA